MHNEEMKQPLSFLTGLFLLVTTVLSPFPAFAQSPTGTVNPPGYGTICMAVEREVTPGTNGKNVRRRIVTGSGFPINTPIYIVNVTDTVPPIKTSGDPTVDAKLAVWGASYVDGIMNFVEGQAEMTTTDGNIRVVLNAVPEKVNGKRNPAAHVMAHFFGVYEVTGPLPTEGAEIEGQGGGQKQGTLVYSNLFSDEDAKNCAGFQWDPEGRVFDANTLEPMGDVRVFIYQMDGAGKKVYVNDPTVNNPFDTLNGQTPNDTPVGAYAFYVPEGTYYLAVTPPPGYRMITSLDQVHQNYSQNNLYSQIYLDGQPIVEIPPVVEHRDITLISDTKKTMNDLKVVTHTEMVAGANTSNPQYHCWGTLSHPLAKITLKQDGEIIHEATADTKGSYDFLFPMSVTKTTPIEISWEKVDLTQDTPLGWIHTFLSWFGGTYAYAEQTVLTSQIQPILRNINGYAYDASGKVIANAQVTIKLQSNNVVVYTATADERGHFSVPSRNIPIFAYYLTFTNPATGSTIRKETSEHAKENKIEGNYNKEEALRYKQTKGSASSVQAPSGIPSQTSSEISKEKQNKKEQELYILVGIILTLVIAGGVGIFFFMKKNLSNNTLPPMQ